MKFLPTSFHSILAVAFMFVFLAIPGVGIDIDRAQITVAPYVNAALECGSCTQGVDSGWGWDWFYFQEPNIFANSPDFGGGGGGGGGVLPATPLCTLSATPTSGVSGTQFSLAWQVWNTQSATISPTVGALQLITTPVANGTRTVSPHSTTTYTLSALGTNGQTVTCNATVTVTTPPPPPICVLDLTKDTITWTTENAHTVTITSPTNSPAVPMTILPKPAGTTVWSGHFHTFRATYLAAITADLNANGGPFSIDGFHGNKATADRLCAVAFPGSVNGTFQTGKYHSPGNNTVLLWNGVKWLQQGARNLNTPLDKTFTCVSQAVPGSYALSGSHTFVPPLGVGTHTYNLTAVGDGGTVQCSKTITIDPIPPAPGCIKILKETFDPQGNKLSTVAQFTFKLNGNEKTTQNDAQGNAIFTNVTPGTHTVTEVLPSANWKLLSVTPANGQVVVESGSNCAAVVFKNQQVVEPSPAPVCEYFTATPSTIDQGNTSTLAWKTKNATSVSINQGVGSVALTGSEGVTPSSTRTYTLTATGPGGSVTCDRKVTVIPKPAAPVCVLTADKNSIEEGSSTKINWSTTNAVSVSINKGIGAVSANGSRTVTPQGLTTYTLTALGAGGEQAVCKATIDTYIAHDPVGVCTLTTNKTTLGAGESATLSWTISHAVEATLKHLNATTNLSPQNGSQTVSAVGTYLLTIKDAKGRTDTCEVTLTQASVTPQPQCTLTVSQGTIQPGQSVDVSWTSSNVTAGFINNNVGTTTPVSSGTTTMFPSQTTTYTGTFTGPHGNVTCTAQVAVQGGPGGGCTNCGGGLNQPNVVLFQKPGDQALAFVSLSQIPYTGFEAGPVLTFFFWLAVMLWSVGIAYILIGRGGLRFVAERVFAFAPQQSQSYDAYEYDNGLDTTSHSYDSYKEYATPEEEEAMRFSTTAAPTVPYVAPVGIAHTAPAVAAPSPKAPANDGIPALTDVLESRAHAAGILLSPEALALAQNLSSDRTEALKKFGDILNTAVRTIPREDGWILLSSDRFNELLGSAATFPVKAVRTSSPQVAVESPSVPKVSGGVLAESAANTLARAILSGDRDGAFALVREHEKEDADPTKLMAGVATIFDGLYCGRRDSFIVGGDLALTESAAHVSDEALVRLVEVMTHAIDGTYASVYTGVKLAVAQAFDLIG